MNSNFHFGSPKKFNSDYFCLIPSKYVTFGIVPLNKIDSQISENSSNKDNDIFFRQIPSFQNDKFNFDLNNTPMKKEDKNIIRDFSEKEKISLGCFYNFKFGRKTVLNTVNTCLLDLFSESNNNYIEAQNKTKKTLKKNMSNNYILKALNEDYILYNKTEDEIPKNKKTVSFLDKLNFSPIKKINYHENLNNTDINIKQKNEELNKDKIGNSSDEKNYLNQNNKFYSQSAFKIINNNKYQNPAKIPQFIMAPNFCNSSNFPPNNIQNITNITNVTNNYFFVNNDINNNIKNNSIINKPPNQTLKKDHNNINKKQITLNISKIKEKSKEKKEKTDNEKSSHKINNNNINNSYGLYQLNQISVNGISISKFPVVSMNEDDLEVQLLSKMLTDTEYFTIVDKYYINIPVLEEEKYKKPSYDKIFKKEKEKISNLYLIGKNLNENNPVNLIRNYYGQIKDKILQIQTNYLTNKQPKINVELCKELEKLITSCNAITNTVTDYKKSGLKRKAFNDSNNESDNNNE